MDFWVAVRRRPHLLSLLFLRLSFQISGVGGQGRAAQPTAPARSAWGHRVRRPGTREKIERLGAEVLAKAVPDTHSGRVDASDFEIDERRRVARCPAGTESRHRRPVVHWLRSRHPAHSRWPPSDSWSPEPVHSSGGTSGRTVVVEHRIARLVQLGLRQAKYLGTGKGGVSSGAGSHGRQRVQGRGVPCVGPMRRLMAVAKPVSAQPRIIALRRSTDPAFRPGFEMGLTPHSLQIVGNFLTLRSVVDIVWRMDRAERAELLLQQEEATARVVTLQRKIEGDRNACTNTATALDLVLSHSDLVSECFSQVDEGILVLPDITGTGDNAKLNWGKLREINPDQQLSGIVRAVTDLRDAKANLRSIRSKLA